MKMTPPPRVRLSNRELIAFAEAYRAVGCPVGASVLATFAAMEKGNARACEELQNEGFNTSELAAIIALMKQPTQWLLLRHAPLETIGYVFASDRSWGNRTDVTGQVHKITGTQRYRVSSVAHGFNFTHWHPLLAPPPRPPVEERVRKKRK